MPDANTRPNRLALPRRLPVSVLGSLTAVLLCQLALAAVLPDPVNEVLQERAAAFVQAPGFTEADPELLQHELLADQRLWNDEAAGSVFLPDANLDPLSKAVLLLESQEAPLQHYRYLLTYLQLAASPDYPEAVQEYVQVSRFNLGPALYGDVVAVYGEDAAPVEEFGVGPDVSWRFVFSSVMGQRSAIFAASRHEFTDGEAAALNCLGESCFALLEPVMPDGEFHSTQAPALADLAGPAPYMYRAYEAGVSLPVRVAAEMFSAVTQHGFEAAMGDSMEPQLTLVISHNVSGQDENSFALLRQGRIMDHAISEIWLQRREVSSGDPAATVVVEWQEVTVPRANP
jgi:Ca-activated chloride channel family protein